MASRRKLLQNCVSTTLISLLISSPVFAKQSDGTYSPVSTGSGLMTKSQSVASGMSMHAKYNSLDQFHLLGAHPIVSLRKNQSDAEFDLGMGTVTSNVKTNSSESESEISVMHVGFGTTIVTASGVRFGAHMEIGDDPIKTKIKKPIKYNSKVKVSMQDLSFFAAAGLTQNLGVAMNMLMADRKIGDNSETATLISPAVMAMFDSTELVFDIVQSNDDVGVSGHWRLGVVHELEANKFLTGEMLRMQPNYGSDYWHFAVGGRKQVSNKGSFGGEFLFSQQHDNDSDKCSTPRLLGVRGDIDNELTANQVVSFGAEFKSGNCSEDGRDERDVFLLLKGGFGMMF